jgi:arabinofuranosyltransferase
MRPVKHLLLFFLLLSAVTLIAWCYLGRPTPGIDDADIFLNYARHLAHGEGFVFNKGGERVEGFTSLLWVVTCSAFYHLTNHPETLLVVFQLLLTSLTVTMVYEAAVKDIAASTSPTLQRNFIYIFCGYITCIGPGFVTWSVLSLMENALWNFLYTAILVLLQNSYSAPKPSSTNRILLLVLAPLLILCRPEAMAWIIFFTGALAWTYRKKGLSLLFPAAFLGLSIITTTALILFRTHYFGYPLPNTYYAKVSPDRWYNIVNGLRYSLNFLARYNPFVTLLVISLLLYLPFSYRWPSSPRLVLLSLLAWMALLLPCVTGDDHFGGFRFYQYLLLPAIWGIAVLFQFYRNNTHLYLGGVVLLFCAFFAIDSLFGLKSPLHNDIEREFTLAADGKATAKELNALFARTGRPSAAVIVVGGFALDYNGPTVDLMGLNDKRMGHSPGDRKGIRDHAAFNKDVFYQEGPDIVMPSIVAGQREASSLYNGLLDTTSFENRALKNIFAEQQFRSRYVSTMITDKASGKSVFLFCSTSWLPLLSKDSSLILTAAN